MRKFIWVVPVLAALAGCDGMSQQQMVGTAGGAAIGAAVTRATRHKARCWAARSDWWRAP